MLTFVCFFLKFVHGQLWSCVYNVHLNCQGHIVSCDPWFACLFGYNGRDEIVGKHVKDLIPSIQLPDVVSQQVSECVCVLMYMSVHVHAYVCTSMCVPVCVYVHVCVLCMGVYVDNYKSMCCMCVRAFYPLATGTLSTQKNHDHCLYN